MGEKYPTETLIIRGPNGGRHVISGQDTKDVILGDTFEHQAKEFRHVDQPEVLTNEDWNMKQFDTKARQRRNVTVFNPEPSAKDRLFRRKEVQDVFLDDQTL